MKYLLDTCTFIWLLTGSDELSKLALDVGSSRESGVFVSVVSIWELLVKHTLGKLPLPSPPEQRLKEAIEEMGFIPLELGLEAVFQLPKLPQVHRDPFDRLLICQSIAGGLTLLTPDPEIRQYPVLTAW